MGLKFVKIKANGRVAQWLERDAYSKFALVAHRQSGCLINNRYLVRLQAGAHKYANLIYRALARYNIEVSMVRIYPGPHFMSDLTFTQTLLVLLAVIWSLFWKGMALWRSARGNQRNWFIALLVINTLGILEIVFLVLFAKKKA